MKKSTATAFSRLSNFIYSLINCLIALFFILLGLIALILPWSPSIRTELIQFFLEKSLPISLFGLGFLAIGIAILTQIILKIRHTNYYVIHSGINSVLVDEEILQKYLSSYWQQLFPSQDVSSHFVIKKNKIKVFAELPGIAPEEHDMLVKHIESDLSDIFNRILGYTNDFVLQVSFKKNNSKKLKNDRAA